MVSGHLARYLGNSFPTNIVWDAQGTVSTGFSMRINRGIRNGLAGTHGATVNDWNTGASLSIDAKNLANPAHCMYCGVDTGFAPFQTFWHAAWVEGWSNTYYVARAAHALTIEWWL